MKPAPLIATAALPERQPTTGLLTSHVPRAAGHRVRTRLTQAVGIPAQSRPSRLDEVFLGRSTTMSVCARVVTAGNPPDTHTAGSVSVVVRCMACLFSCAAARPASARSQSTEEIRDRAADWSRRLTPSTTRLPAAATNGYRRSRPSLDTVALDLPSRRPPVGGVTAGHAGCSEQATGPSRRGRRVIVTGRRARDTCARAACGVPSW